MNYLIQGETLENIANAIRNKTNQTETISVNDIANQINNINVGSPYMTFFTDEIIDSNNVAESRKNAIKWIAVSTATPIREYLLVGVNGSYILLSIQIEYKDGSVLDLPLCSILSGFMWYAVKTNGSFNMEDIVKITVTDIDT